MKVTQLYTLTDTLFLLHLFSVGERNTTFPRWFEKFTETLRFLLSTCSSSCVGRVWAPQGLEKHQPLWNLKHIHGTPNNQFFYGCFNWMIPNHYIKDCCCTKHPLNNGCLGYQVHILELPPPSPPRMPIFTTKIA